MTEISLYIAASIQCIVNMHDTYQTLENVLLFSGLKATFRIMNSMKINGTS